MTNNQTPLSLFVEVDSMSIYIARLKQKLRTKEKPVNLRPEIQQSRTKVQIPNEVADYIKQWLDLDDPATIVINETIFQEEAASSADSADIEGEASNIIALNRLNDIRYINKFLESLNKKVTKDGLVIGCVETSDFRKERIFKNSPGSLKKVNYGMFYLLHRVFPKVPYLKKMYFSVTKGRNRVLSEMEVYGRLYSCGFQLVDSKVFGNKLYFVAKKQQAPAYNIKPTYGPLIHLNRVGQHNKMIKVYKLRSMYPYSEYIQQFIFEKQGLQDGGKFKDDPRVSTIGKLLRKYWLDELPMLINIIKGDLKIVGVRPVSQNYLKNVYPEEFLEYRKNFKPGFIPPFYADMPKTTEELIASEERYLKAYEKQPFMTDMRYMMKALNNVLFKMVRSN